MTTEQVISLRASVNFWLGKNFPHRRKYISHSNPIEVGNGKFQIRLHFKNDGKIFNLGDLLVESNEVNLLQETRDDMENRLSDILKDISETNYSLDSLVYDNYEFHFDDGITAIEKMDDASIDLLLTDPPYSISKPYICESQIPRRLRKSGGDFIMPKGNFGDWDNNFPSPDEWTERVLPKVGGWAVIFCAHAQIGDYCRILEQQKFVAVGPMVWHKTNPVPFNHKYKPISAWEAIVVGKRSGTKFNGHAVHNVFTCKSPSPQQRIHSTQKPDDLLKEFVDLFSNPDGLVVDPFAGSGSTLLASVGRGRKAIAYENDAAMFDKAAKRILDKLGVLS